MKVYLVGGAVRDELLDYPFKEKDWVVTGSSPEEMEGLGYHAVGKDFPVYLHPKTKEEYALARTERKTAPGYQGFNFNISPAVTLEQDLARRDLTINAIAKDETGTLIDPYHGQHDLQEKCLRHVSAAFTEDPVRVLRIARFAARFAHLGFTVAKETNTLMQNMVSNGEINALVAERVWQEFEKALEEKNPEVFISTLRDCNALKALFPEIDRLFGVPQPENYHPEIDTGIHTLMVLQQACLLSDDPVVRFASLTHDLGKGTTAKEKWPSHHGHEQRGEKLVKALCERIKVPNKFRELAAMTAKFHTHCHKALILKPETVTQLFRDCDAYRKPERFAGFLLACEADSKGRTGLEKEPYPQAEYLAECFAACHSIKTSDLEKGLEGKAIGDALEKKRTTVVKNIKTAISR
ncbi:MAG: multifunctional CCA addition/repair protein [Gammaproteobacteria bacterium]|nr:multifunctional CCA addition/repair protein [Gammaproteobacteria bacterium]